MRLSPGRPIELGVSILREIVVDINMVRFSAILLHMLPTSAQCGYNASKSRGHRKPLKNP